MDNALETTIVTADGNHAIANPYSNGQQFPSPAQFLTTEGSIQNLTRGQDEAIRYPWNVFPRPFGGESVPFDSWKPL